MAESQMLTIADEALVKHHLERVIVHHRIGKLEIGDIAVGIACSAAHRPEAFAGCRYIIEELKNRVPIWKKEVFADGAEWVDPRP
jgi:molybdopterin synthase catalytic subunit